MLLNNIELDIKTKCIETGTTQKEVAERIDVSLPYVNRITKGREQIINKTFVKIMENNATTFIVLLVLTPMFMIDKPYNKVCAMSIRYRFHQFGTDLLKSVVFHTIIKKYGQNLPGFFRKKLYAGEDEGIFTKRKRIVTDPLFVTITFHLYVVLSIQNNNCYEWGEVRSYDEINRFIHRRNR